MPTNSSYDDILDVAIVGGGVSGLYSGWRLLTDRKDKPKVALFEMSKRLGGRLLSVVPPGIPEARVELGGMRYTSRHTLVVGLTNHLGLNSQPFPVAEPQNMVYVRGHLLRHQELTDPDALPYNFAPGEDNPSDLADGFTAVAARRALRVILGKDVPLESADWRKIGETGLYDGHHLTDISMRYVMLRSVSHEAFRFAEDTSGYDSILYTWNAADGFPWNLADFGAGVKYLRLTQGYVELPLEIAKRFEDAGGQVNLGHRLTRFDEANAPDGSDIMELDFAGPGGERSTVRARNVILAMPRRSLELLEQSGAVLDPGNTRVHELIRSVTPIPLFKLAICYSFPWWQTIAPVEVEEGGKAKMKRIESGESVTDLPIRQCYYWAVDPESQNAVVLIYDDGRDLDYWAGLRDPLKNAPFRNDASVAPPAHPEWSSYQAPDIMVQEAHRQLKKMHGVEGRSDIPAPYAAAYRDWGEDPYGGGANFWHLHVRSHTVASEILQPKPPVPVYICGEAYSHAQGWVEGALHTAEQMLERHFDLAPPSWLKKTT